MAFAGLIALALLAADTPDCTITQPVITEDLAGWSRTGEAGASADAASAPQLGATRTRLALLPTGDVRFAAAPERPATQGYSGLASFEVAKEGRVRIALDKGAWIDVARDGKVIRSVAHGHGPACSGIRKIVDFDLQPGRYLLQIVGAPAAEISALVATPQ